MSFSLDMPSIYTSGKTGAIAPVCLLSTALTSGGARIIVKPGQKKFATHL